MAAGKVRSFSFKSMGEIGADNPSRTRPKTIKPLSIKTPMALGQNRTGIFDMHVDPREMIRDNLKNLVLTNRGERLGNSNVGANLRSLCAERISRDAFDAEAMIRIQKAVGAFMPFVELEDYSSTFDTPLGEADASMSTVTVTIVYNVPRFKIVKNSIAVKIHVVG